MSWLLLPVLFVRNILWLALEVVMFGGAIAAFVCDLEAIQKFFQKYKILKLVLIVGLLFLLWKKGFTYTLGLLVIVLDMDGIWALVRRRKERKAYEGKRAKEKEAAKNAAEAYEKAESPVSYTHLVSAEFESFQDGLLEYPQYSRPEVWHEKEVPPVLLSGNHTNIEGWRQELSILRTKERRPDLYETYREQQKEMQEKNKRKRRFKGVIFDMDGCLIDSERLYAQCWKMAFHKMGIPISDETLNSWNGIGGKELERAIESVTGEARLIPEVRAIRDGYLAGALEDGRMPLMPYAKEIVTLAKEKGMTVGVASGTIRERAEKMLRFHGIYEMLDCTAFGNEVQAGKPAPDLYRLAMKRGGLKPSEVIAFEDSLSGVKAARAAGLRTVYVLSLIHI